MLQRFIVAAIYILSCFQFTFVSKNTGNPLKLSISVYQLSAAPLSSSEPTVRLRILYSDTLDYDTTTTLNGCSGERVPVTIRAVEEGNAAVPTVITAITLTTGNGLKVYAAPTSTEPITTTQLIAGQVVIFIQAVTKYVDNGTVAAVASDPDIISCERAGIYFKECFIKAEGGAFFSTNGRGAVDKATIYYTSALDPIEVPDSILLCWPNSSTDCRKVYKAAGDIVQDPSNPAQVIVTPPLPFPEAQTKINGLNLDLAFVFWVNPATPYAPSINQSVAMQDSVGPLLLTATLIERLQPGHDTLIITFTEPVDYQKLPGQTLTLITAGQQFPLFIKNAQPGNNQAVIVTVDNTLSDRIIAANDSLMITPTGTVSDNNGNKPHPMNRPVVVRLSTVAPSIVAAFYRDGNSDGIVDTVRALFNKGIVLNDAVGIRINFVQKESRNAEPARMQFVDGTDNTTIDIQMDYLFTILDLQDKTSGSMSVDALFGEFESNNRSSIIAEDKAAPVLIAVDYHFGNTGSGSTEAEYDTLFARFSEPLKDVPHDKTPIKFISASGVLYNVPVFTESNYAPCLVTSGTMSGYYRFIVAVKGLTVEGGTRGVGNVVNNAKDSAWINTLEFAVSDNSGNVQVNHLNKRVPVVVKQPSGVSRQESRQFPTEDQTASGACGSCGSGTLLSFIPPVFFYTRQRLRKKRNQKK